jgi:hypothetical protein
MITKSKKKNCKISALTILTTIKKFIIMETYQRQQTDKLTLITNMRNVEDVDFVEVNNNHQSLERTNTNHNKSPFIESNTNRIKLQELKKDFIPVFSKDNESTISHYEFIESVYSAINRIFQRETISDIDCRVSHKICGRIPTAIGKPVNELEEWEKTQYYERMAFSIDIGSIRDTINNNELKLSIVGVRAYNHTNLYGKKNPETFKLAIGFMNQVCTNMCISTDGSLSEIKVSSIRELEYKATELFHNYNLTKHINSMKSLPQMSLSESQFATFIGRTRLYQFLPKEEKNKLPDLQFGDSHLNMVAKDYYHDKRFCKNEDNNLNLWSLYNLFTNANRNSSYIDKFLDRGHNAAEFINGISSALNGDTGYKWFIE